jgi:biotin carboxylase
LNALGLTQLHFYRYVRSGIKMSLDGKNILILGGNPETGSIVEVANKLGMNTVVADPNPGAPSKRNASISYDVDVTNLLAIDQIIVKEKIHGVLVGVADPLVPYYQKICERHGFNCYATDRIIQVLSSKSNFSKVCEEFGLFVTPNYKIDYKNDSDIKKLQYPVVVKPVDSGAGVGISICNDPEEFNEGVDRALNVSIKKEILIEKYMNCDDMFAYYTFINGKAYLSALADRHKTTKQGKFSAVCIAAEYPSKYANRFINEVHPKLLKMFGGLCIENGVLLIQFFVDDSSFYAYDPGFRLQGEAPHIYLKHFNKFDQREMLLKFALDGEMYSGDFSKINDLTFGGNFGTTMWILLRSGNIHRIEGLDVIKKIPNVIMVLQRFFVGDSVKNSMLGTERQVLARIYIASKSKEEASKTIDFVKNNIHVEDENGEDMILDVYQKRPYCG